MQGRLRFIPWLSRSDGDETGCVRVWDPRVKEAVLSLEPAEGESARDCWTVAFGNSFTDEERCIVAGYDNGDVKLFDLRMNTLRWETNVGNGVVSAEFDRKDIEMNKLLVTTLESRFHVFDMRTQHPESGFAGLTERVRETPASLAVPFVISVRVTVSLLVLLRFCLQAHKSTVWLGRHLPQNRDVFLTAGGNGGLNIYRYMYPRKRAETDSEGRMRGVAGRVELLNARVVASQPIVGFDWSPDKEGLAVAASLDQAVRVFIVTKLDRF